MNLPEEIVQKAVDSFARRAVACNDNGGQEWTVRECIERMLEDVTPDIVRHAMDHGVRFRSDT